MKIQVQPTSYGTEVQIELPKHHDEKKVAIAIARSMAFRYRLVQPGHRHDSSRFERGEESNLVTLRFVRDLRWQW